MEPSKNTHLDVTYYTPIEILSIYRSFLERGKSNGIVWLRGIYIKRKKQDDQWAAFYDELRDVNNNTTVTLKINRQDRIKLKSNSLVQIGGIIELNPFVNGTIQIVVYVTRFKIVKDQFVTEKDLKRSEIRIEKSKKGFKNVDAVLEEKLFRDEHPKVALIFASTSITMLDFNAGVNAAAVKIDFTELRQSFGNGVSLSSFLSIQDNASYDVIALIRGGGSGIESLDDIDVLKTVANMKTPVICAIGHVGEELFMKSIADKVAPTPNGLGQYFSEMVEHVIAKRNNSRAVLVDEVKKQFEKQLEESNKKNRELLLQIQSITKQSQEQTKTFNESMEKIQTDNKKNLETQQKKDEETLKMIQSQNKIQMENADKQNLALQKQLQNLTKSQKDSLDRLTEQNKTTNSLLDKERLRSMSLEQKISNTRNKYTIIIIILIISILICIFISNIF